MRYTVLLLFLFLFLSCAAPQAPSSYIPLMPSAIPDMNNAGFWIGKTANPDALLAGSDEIAALNLRERKKGGIIALSNYEEFRGAEFVRASILTLSEAAKYLKDEELAKALKANSLGWLKNSSAGVVFGVVVKNVDQRVLPTTESVGRYEGDMLDRFQMSSLPLGEAAAALSLSLDEEWVYVRASRTVGWIKVKEFAAVNSREELAVWETPSRFAVSLLHHTPIYADEKFTAYLGQLPLGAKLPLEGKTEGALIVRVPFRGEGGDLYTKLGYIEKTSANEGFAAYTSRNVLNLAFRHLNAPYGWGGGFGEQDCSGFLLRLFAAFGIELPRNSSEQGKAGKSASLSRGVKRVLKDSGVPGATLVQLPGHIMLYIGEHEGEPYVIHSILAFINDNKTIYPARTVVSDMNLSKSSKNGALIERITNIRNLF